ncbi:MAG: triose-phosphate isomerase [Candidatus Doudnabacteria bacterium]|nr:triose-phosphate isomerase [Candidatus Doudnabacteria bacterium]
MKKLVVANWKLNPTTAKDAVKLASSINIKAKNKVVLCPPTIYLSSISYPNVGAQDCFWKTSGAFTGQTSVSQLKDLKIKYCIVGHSERRATGDTDQMINGKIHSLLEAKITPILCVGYGTTVLQDDLEVVDILKHQLDAGLNGVDASKVVVAYEPVWAIGTGKNASPEHAEKISIFIKAKYKVGTVLYGGSVNANNAKDFLRQQNVGGLLVGGASLKAGEFNGIINY